MAEAANRCRRRMLRQVGEQDKEAVQVDYLTGTRLIPLQTLQQMYHLIMLAMLTLTLTLALMGAPIPDAFRA